MSPDILFALAVTLIPVAAMSGWYYRGHARGKSQSSRERLQGQLARNYLDGLRFLLDDKPDRAIETFLRTLEVDEDTIETHFALANLFRRRGEVSRAIRIHQNLISRAGLSTEQRITAVRELAIDYYRAGLLDRAEVLFRELLDTGPRHNEDLKYLLDIYRQERDWDKAVEIAGLLQQARVSGMEREHAHLLCEQAAEGGVDGALHDARDLLEQALIIDHRCVRARLMLAGLERNAGQYRRAIRHLEQVVTQDRAFVPEILEPLVACYQALGRTDELHAYLAELARMRTGTSTVLKLAELEADAGQVDGAIRLLLTELRDRPSLQGLDRLVSYLLLQGTNDDAALSQVREFTHRLVATGTTYRCQQCGFEAHSLHWQCPGCKAWSTVKPVDDKTGD